MNELITIKIEMPIKRTSVFFVVVVCLFVKTE